MTESNKSDEKFLTPGRIIATVVVIGLIATIGYTLLSYGSKVKTESSTVLPGTTISNAAPIRVPADYNVPTVDGRTIKLSEYRGKVVVLDFWATWCPPCRQEVPQLVRIADQNRARGVEVIGLHIDDQGRSTPDDIKKFIDYYGITYTVGMANNDMFEAYLGREETAIPQTLVFDRNGRVVAHLIGYDGDDARTLDEAVNRALAGS